MSALVFLVRGRSVDLVAMTATRALRDTMGLEGRLHSLLRDDLIVLEGARAEEGEAWTEACTSHAHWFNPNKHRHAMVEAVAGALDAARDSAPWPEPWLRKLLHTDRPDLVARHGTIEDPLEAWTLGRETEAEGVHAVTLVSWDHEDAGSALPAGHWPDPDVRVLSLVAWTLRLKVAKPAEALELAREVAVTRGRRHGLLVHPHMQGWAQVAPAASA